jgi:hypothetical protein
MSYLLVRMLLFYVSFWLDFLSEHPDPYSFVFNTNIDVVLSPHGIVAVPS